MRIKRITVIIDGREYFAEDVELTELEEVSVEVQPRWDPILNKSVTEINWGKDAIAARIRYSFKSTSIKCVAHVLAIKKRGGTYAVRKRAGPARDRFIVDHNSWHNSFHSKVMGYGKKSHLRVLGVLSRLHINPNMDLTSFPWEIYHPPQP